MNHAVDLSYDQLAEAVLTPEQRDVWNGARAELAEARSRLQKLELEVSALREKIEAEDLPKTVLSRPEFNREVARMLAFDERYGGMSSVVYFDFENLGEITKTYGNDVANAVARIVCDTIAHQVRSSDIFGRLAPNEFGILLVRCDNANAWKKAEGLANVLQNALVEVEGHEMKPVISYGAYTFHENEDAAGGLKNAAEAVTRSN